MPGIRRINWATIILYQRALQVRLANDTKNWSLRIEYVLTSATSRKPSETLLAAFPFEARGFSARHHHAALLKFKNAASLKNYLGSMCQIARKKICRRKSTKGKYILRDTLLLPGTLNEARKQWWFKCQHTPEQSCRLIFEVTHWLENLDFDTTWEARIHNPESTLPRK